LSKLTNSFGMSTLALALLFLLIGLVLGAACALLWWRLRQTDHFVARTTIERDYVARGVFDTVQAQADLHYENLQEKLERERELVAQLAAMEQEHRYLRERTQEQATLMEQLQEESRQQFERIANQLLEEKSQRFADQNQERLGALLTPLREKISTFEQQVERRFLEETRDRVSLKKEIEQLRDLNQQLSNDANNLAGALRGDSKQQGDWGEWQLETLLQRSGLQPDVHYRTQHSFRDTAGRQKRPDFIIHLPDDKHLVIDSKVSLKAYQAFCESSNGERSQHLADHVASLRRHVKDLQSKNYQQLYQINSPDYVLLFVPIEPAFSLALERDNQLFLDALDSNIVLVTSSTLLATLRTVSFIWKQERQKRSVLEIARQSGLLYDKFCNFVEDLRQVGRQLDSSQRAYEAAMHKLTDGQRHGDTLIGRAERLRELGAKSTKRLPKELLGD
jgi:DNA recombination protein RmuC